MININYAVTLINYKLDSKISNKEVYNTSKSGAMSFSENVNLGVFDRFYNLTIF